MHQANQLKLAAAWKDDLPPDEKIYQDDFDRCGAPWGRVFTRFKGKLERLGDRAYQGATHDFRNAYNHRFSPHFVIGVQAFVKREVQPEGGVTYAFGEWNPFDLAEMVKLLKVQHDAALQAFAAFQTLVRAHEAAIAADAEG